MGQRRARASVGGRLALTAAALFVLAFLLGAPLLSPFASASPARTSDARPSQLQGGPYCPAPTNASGLEYCVAVSNNGAPAVVVNPNNATSAATSVGLDVVQSPVIEVTWRCYTQLWIDTIVFDIQVLGLTVVQSPLMLSSNVDGTNVQYRVCLAGDVQEANLTLTQLDGWGDALSGVYSGVITMETNNTPYGDTTSFYVNVIPAYPPFTYFTAALMAISVYELFQVARDFLRLNRSRPARKEPLASPPSSGGPGAPAAATPTAATAPAPAPATPAAPSPPAAPAAPTAPPAAPASPPPQPASPPPSPTPPPAYPAPGTPPPVPGSSPNSPWRAPPAAPPPGPSTSYPPPPGWTPPAPAGAPPPIPPPPTPRPPPPNPPEGAA